MRKNAEHSMKTKRYLKKSEVAARYGNVTPRTVDEYVRLRKIPAPEYPLQNEKPLWDEQKLDESDRRAAIAQPKREPEKITNADASEAAQS
jgi:hypothetical protein